MDNKIVVEITENAVATSLHTSSGRVVTWTMLRDGHGWVSDRTVTRIVDDLVDALGWDRPSCEDLFNTINEEDHHDAADELVGGL